VNYLSRRRLLRKGRRKNRDGGRGKAGNGGLRETEGKRHGDTCREAGREGDWEAFRQGEHHSFM
jgi:hypothetical protein